MVSFDYRGFWFVIKSLFIFFLAVFLAKNTPYWFLKTELDPGNAQIQQLALTASAVKIDKDKPLKLALVGDIMLSRNVEKAIFNVGNGDFNFPFLKLGNELRNYDLLFGNLEGPISDRGEDIGSPYSFRMSAKTAEALRDTGFDVLSVANNHIGDWGAKGIYDTIFHLKRVGLAYVGAGLTEDEASGAKFFEIGNTRFAFLAFNDVPSFYIEKNDEVFVSSANPGEIQKQIKKAKEAADIVIVSFHFGEEYQSEPSPSQKTLAQFAVEQGADLVIGHHPHVTQPIEKYKNSFIAYSLGNFVFDQNFSEDTMRGLLLDVELEDGQIAKVESKTIVINENFQPILVKNCVGIGTCSGW